MGYRPTRKRVRGIRPRCRKLAIVTRGGGHRWRVCRFVRRHGVWRCVGAGCGCGARPYAKMVAGARRCGKSHLPKNLYRGRPRSQRVRDEQVIAVKFGDKRFEGQRDRRSPLEYGEGKRRDGQGQELERVGPGRLSHDMRGVAPIGEDGARDRRARERS